MARSGIEQIAVIVDTTCGNPRADEATKWNQVKDSLKSISKRGQTLVSAWGPKVDGNVKPILGGSRQTRVEGESRLKYFFPHGVHTYEVMFEQPSFQTSGALSVADQFVLDLRFVLCNIVFSGTYNGDTYTYEIFGKVKVSLSNTNGTQVLFHYASSEYLALTGGTGIDSESVTSTDLFREISKVQHGTIDSVLMPPIGQALDARLVFEIDGYLEQTNSSGITNNPIIDIENGFTDILVPANPPYLGIAGATFRIFNPAQ